MSSGRSILVTAFPKVQMDVGGNAQPSREPTAFLVLIPGRH